MEENKSNIGFDAKLDALDRGNLNLILSVGIIAQILRLITFHFSQSNSDMNPSVLYLTFIVILSCYFLTNKTRVEAKKIILVLYAYALLVNLLNHWFIFRPNLGMTAQMAILFIGLMFNQMRWVVFYYIWVVMVPVLGTIILPQFGVYQFQNPELNSTVIFDGAITLGWASVFVAALMFQRESLVKSFSAKALKEIAPEVGKSGKYAKSNLSNDDIQRLSNVVLDFLVSKKNFLDPEIKAGDISKKLNIPLYKLSQVFSMGLNQSFNTVVTSLRIEEAKRRLRDKSFRDEKILSIALDCGFSSKSTFNTYFKKMVGVTPKAYRDAFSESPITKPSA